MKTGPQGRPSACLPVVQKAPPNSPKGALFPKNWRRFETDCRVASAIVKATKEAQ